MPVAGGGEEMDHVVSAVFAPQDEGSGLSFLDLDG